MGLTRTVGLTGEGDSELDDDGTDTVLDGNDTKDKGHEATSGVW